MKLINVEVISGVEGPCLSIGNESGGRRIAGPKPWGGGNAIHSFTVSVEELIEYANKLSWEEVNND